MFCHNIKLFIYSYIFPYDDESECYSEFSDEEIEKAERLSLNLPAELAPLPDEFKDIFDNYALRKTCTEESIQPVDEIDGNSSSDSNNEVGVIPEYLDNWFTKHENLLEC